MTARQLREQLASLPDDVLDNEVTMGIGDEYHCDTLTIVTDMAPVPHLHLGQDNWHPRYGRLP
jgi:hypothetical protein